MGRIAGVSRPIWMNITVYGTPPLPPKSGEMYLYFSSIGRVISLSLMMVMIMVVIMIVKKNMIKEKGQVREKGKKMKGS